MKILILGGTGFIGSYLVRYFTELKWDVFAPTKEEMDLFNLNSVRLYFRDHSFDIVIHAATPTYYPNGGILVENLGSKILFMYLNLIPFTTNMRCFYLGSGADRQDTELGKAKQRVLECIRENSNWIYLRIFGIFGIGEHPSRFFPSIFKEIQSSQTITIKNPKGIFSWIDIKDFCKIMELMCDQTPNYKEYDVCNCEFKSLDSWGNFLSKETGAKLILEQKPPYHYGGDNKHLIREFNFQFTPMECSILTYYKSFLAEHISNK